MKIAIVAVGYNRPSSMMRLLKSIIKAKYDEYTVDLIISIDKGEKQNEIAKLAETIHWEYGEKKIRMFKEKQGLRNHIIQCGNYTSYYDAVVVLEDDLIVSPYYFSYVKQAISKYSQDEKIAGISLYKLQFQQGVCRPFEPVHNGYDAFLMQVAQSWGQCWTKKMWNVFLKWYEENKNVDLSEGGILPDYIAKWNTQSWLKYYMRYIVEKNLFFVYPIISLSSNSSEIGEHCSIPSNDYQVALLQGDMRFRLPSYKDAVKYDVFFERMEIEEYIFPELTGKKILDLYGGRTMWNDADYIISTVELPFKKIREISLQYRPMEMNCINPQDGEGIYIYDSNCPQSIKKRSSDIVTRFDVKAIHWKKLLRLGLIGFMDAIKRRIYRK